MRRGNVELPLARLERHLLVLGASGSGKTETLLRLAWAVARASDWQVLFLDAKGDERTQRRFHALMRAAGREARLFPREPYDGWRGEAREITNRLIGLIDFAQEGGATYYRDTATNIVRLATEAPGGPPRSAPELLARLNRARLEALWSGRPETDGLRLPRTLPTGADEAGGPPSQVLRATGRPHHRRVNRSNAATSADGAPARLALAAARVPGGARVQHLARPRGERR